MTDRGGSHCGPTLDCAAIPNYQRRRFVRSRNLVDGVALDCTEVPLRNDQDFTE
jgi:hypothetical protein